MIAFLTLCYIALIYLLVRVRLLPDTLFVRLSPIGFSILLFLFLFVPMQWGAPSGPAVVVRHSVAIVPNVGGQVVSVDVEANKLVKKGDVLFRIDPTQYQAKVDQLTAQLKLAQLRQEQYAQLAARNAGNRFRVEETQANVASLKAQLADAQWQLKGTTVRAPADGFATYVALRPGARVASVPMAATMPFFDTSETVVGVQIHQIHTRFIEPGQEAELTFKEFPGQVFSAKVDLVLPAISQGQVAVSGAAVTPGPISPAPFFVRLKLDNPKIAAKLHAGAYGEAAIYTSSMQAAHVIRRVMLRMQAWINYLSPV
jgi:multidrug resistance efflux pump